MKKVLFMLLFCCLILNGCKMAQNPDPNEKIGTPLNTIEVSPSSTPSATTTPVVTSNPPVTPETTPSVTPTAGNDATQGQESPVPDSGSNDVVICIDPGHGNPTIKGGQEKIAPNSDETKPAFAYGATGTASKTPEYVINMAVSLKLTKLLEERGFKVILTRKSDDENLGNIDRALIGNEADADLVIRIHADGSDNQQVNGVSVLYPGNKFISDDALLVTSKTAAQFVHDAIIKATGSKPRGIVKREDLTGFNWSTRPVILVEMGFLSNPEEDKRLNEPAYQDKIAAGILGGILDYFEEN